MVHWGVSSSPEASRGSPRVEMSSRCSQGGNSELSPSLARSSTAMKTQDNLCESCKHSNDLLA